MADVIGTVRIVTGEVFAKNANGEVRRLKVGDPILEGEVVLTSAGGYAEIESLSGGIFPVQEQTTVAIDESVFTGDVVSKEDGSITKETLQQIATNTDFNQQLEDEAAAAGLTGGGAEGGHSFVSLARIIEGLDPTNYSFPTNPFGTVPTIQGQANALADDIPVVETPTEPEVTEDPPVITVPPVIEPPIVEPPVVVPPVVIDPPPVDPPPVDPPPVDPPPVDPPITPDDKGNNGHGNNTDGQDDDNPGQGSGGPNGPPKDGNDEDEGEIGNQGDDTPGVNGGGNGQPKGPLNINDILDDGTNDFIPPGKAEVILDLSNPTQQIVNDLMNNGHQGP